MKTSGNTIFISGGSAGIGFEIAKSLYERGNKIIINGRNAERLKKALIFLPNAVDIQGDLSIENERIDIANQLKNNHPDLNIIINNAGEASVYTLDSGANAYINAQKEITTNYLAIIHFTELSLPLLLNKSESAIINISSIAALRPANILPTYGASKAALHSYTTSLRESMKNQAQLQVYEVMPPLVNTAFSASIGGAANGIPPQEVAEELLLALENNQYEVPVGQTKIVHTLLNEAIEKLNNIAGN